jgi:hypothetical membrane protein
MFFLLSGIISILFLICALTYLIKTTPEFEFHKHIVSDLGTLPKTKNIFKIILLIYTFLRLIFFSTLFTRLGLWLNLPIILTFTIAYCSFIVTALISLSVHRQIHIVSALVSGFFTAILIFLLGIHLIQTSLLIGILNIILANSLLWGSWLVEIKKGPNGYFQLYFVSNIIIWDCLMLFFLIRSSGI